MFVHYSADARKVRLLRASATYSKHIKLKEQIKIKGKMKKGAAISHYSQRQ